MLSHFIADSMMPCHCDERDLSDYGKGLHEELESHWGELIGDSFDEKNLLNSPLKDRDILNNAFMIDSKFGIAFKNIVPKIQSKDIWDEVVLLCRSSFAVASIIAPFNIYKYKPDVQTLAKFKDLFTKDQNGKDLLSELDLVVMHDSVLNVAIVWKDIWLNFH
jgi:DNA modification methylase